MKERTKEQGIVRFGAVALCLLALANFSVTKAEDTAFAPIPLVPSALGPYTWPITTDDERAQAYFDQGMQLRYGYSMGEAARSMAEARRIDPDCAICYWGEAFALGSFLNRPMTDDNAALAHAAITRAAALVDGASPVEADLIRAAQLRYPADFDPLNRRAIDEAFANAMAEVHASYPDHTEVATVYSIALFLLEERRGHRDLAHPDLQRLHELLLSVIDIEPAHPGACHLYIHATESTAQPELGLPCAEVLGSAVPGASHIQHMPSHTWNEVGLWRRSVRANLLAWQADRAALRDAGFSYGPSHNLHMLVFAASFDGQGDIAIQAGDDYEQETNNPIYAVLTRLRFGRFDEVLEHGPRPEDPRDAAFHDFARGYSLLRTGDIQGATALRDDVFRYAETTEDRFRFHDAGTLLGALGHLLSGEILLAQGNLDTAIAEFRQAVALEDSLGYDEPEPLPFAPRHWLGAALLEAGWAQQAELVYRTELADHPHNGWSLFGLKQALDAQELRDEMVELDLGASWARADVVLRSSRF
ncbi:MAG: tetratricopeptide repeat protein [Congregibacter sp.]